MSIQIKQNVSIAPFNAMRFDVSARWFCEVTSQSDVLEALEFSRAQGVNPIILGEGSNTVFRSNVDTLVILNRLMGVSIDGNGRVEAASGENWHKLVLATVAQGWFGLENLALIPGTVGAAPMQNIGAYGADLSQWVDSVEVIELASGQIRELTANECGFGYRDSLFKQQARWFITRVNLKLNKVDQPNLEYPGISDYLKQHNLPITAQSVLNAVIEIRRQKLPNPNVIPNAGSFFKNPIVDQAKALGLVKAFPEMPIYDAGIANAGMKKLSAGWLIDQMGLKGMRVGGVKVSDEHALVIVNQFQGTPDDLLRLTDLISERVLSEFGVILEVEPRIYPEQIIL